MKRLVALVLALSLVAQLPAATVINSYRFAAAASGAAFSYDFAGTDNAAWDTAKFTDVGSGTCNIYSPAGENQGEFVNGSFAITGAIYTGGTCSTVSQYMRATIVTAPSNAFPHFIFRYTNSSSPFYVVELDTDSGPVTWYHYDVLNGTGTTIEGGNFGVWSAGDTFSVTIEGTGTSTVVRAWRNATSNTPTSASVWGGAAPGITLSADPASAVDTGASVGIVCYQSSASSQRIDNWFAGDTP